MIVDVALAGLSIVGLAIASYFTAVAYRLVAPDARWIPRFCRMEERSCASIVFAPQARALGPPNSVLGQLFYLAILGGVACGWMDGAMALAYLTASGTTLALGAYLTYALLWVNRVACPLCLAAHVLNAGIFGLLLLRAGL